MGELSVVIEIPKGDDRRRHIAYDKSGFVDLGPIKEKIPVNNGVMPVHYGFIPDTSNTHEGDDVDVLLIADTETTVGQTLQIKPIALIERDDLDHKVVATLAGEGAQKWEELPQLERDLILEYFGYNHTIQAVKPAQDAVKFIDQCRVSKHN